MSKGNYRHGHTPGQRKSPTYVSWQHMKDRCYNPRNEFYHNYGGRGIEVCTRWLRFANFLADMGIRPEGTSLDRIDSKGNYEPGNCRWATRSEQNLNRRNYRMNKRKNANRARMGKPKSEDHGSGGSAGGE